MTQPVEPLTHEQAVATMACERYLLDELSELERQAFEDHFFTCADCADAVRVGELMRVGAREAGTHNSSGVPCACTEARPAATCLPSTVRSSYCHSLAPAGASASMASTTAGSPATGLITTSAPLTAGRRVTGWRAYDRSSPGAPGTVVY